MAEIGLFDVADKHFQRDVQHLGGSEKRVQILGFEKDIHILLSYAHTAGKGPLRSLAGESVPGHALFLSKVEY